jgi:RHS repeat-associated protein
VLLVMDQQTPTSNRPFPRRHARNSRVPYEQKCAPVHPPQPYALSRGWDYTGSTNGLPVSYAITSANGDVQTFQPWSNNYATNDFENCGSAEGLRLTTWTFPQGAAITLNYGNAWDPGVGTGSQGFDQLVSVTNSFAGGSAVRTLAFAQANGVITGVSNAASGLGSRAVTLQFGDYGNPVSITDQAGAVTGFAYGIGTFEPGATRRPTPWASLYQITTPDGLLNTEYDYDSLGRIAQIKDAEALQNADRPPWQFLIADGTRGERDDPLGDAWVVDYDTYGHPMRYTDELGNVTLAQFDGRGQVTSHTFPEGDQELLQYDDHGNEASITKVPKPSSCSGSCPPNITISATWDQTWNKLASLTDANGKTTNFQYYASGYGKSLMQWAKRPAVGGARPVYNFTYDAAGKLLTSTDPVTSTTSITTQNTYDASENLTSTAVDPGSKNLKTTFAYDADANVWWTSDPNQNSTAQNGGTTVFTYDNDRRKLESDHHIGAYTGTLNAASKTIYDLLGRVMEEDTAKCFNGSGCPTSGTSVATWVATKANTYTPTSKVATVTDADGAVTSTTYDAADRTYVVTDPANRQTQFIDDAAGNVLQEIRGLGSPVQMTYATYVYAPDGEKQSVTDADGPTHITTYSYDGFNRLIQTLYPDGTSEQVTLYDANGNVKTRVNRAGQSFNMSYDSLNRLSTKIVPAYTGLGGSPVSSKTVTTTYDLGGRLLDTSDTLGNDVLNHPDTAGRLARVDTTIAGLTGALTSTYALDQNSNRTQLQWPDGYQVNYAYDTLNRMTTATDSASTTLATYAYDAMSRRTGLTYGNTASLAYTYSDAGDLLTLLNDFTNNTKNVSYTLGYSPDHQLASEANSQSTYVWQPGLSGGTDSYATVNAVNQYGSMTPAGGSAQAMTYDGNGNLTCSGTACPTTTPSANASVYAYDPENHLVAAGNTAHSSTYAFDPLGRRQTKTVDSAVTNFLNDGDDELAEYDGSGNVLRRFIPGPAINEPIAYENCTGATAPNCTGSGMVAEYYHTDHHGSVVAMSGSNGNPVNAESGLTYDSYGNSSMSSTGQPFRYVGMYFDSETSLYHDRARCYIPNLGRFCQTDPIGYKDDVDLYTYAGNDPTDKTDPSGLLGGSDYEDDKYLQASMKMTPGERVAVAVIGSAPLAAAACAAGGCAAAGAALLANAPALTTGVSIGGDLLAGEALGGTSITAMGGAAAAEAHALLNAQSAADTAVATHTGGKASSLVTTDGQSFTGLSNRGQAGWSENPEVTSVANSASNAPGFAGQCAECGTASAALNAGAKTQGAVQATVKVGGKGHGQIAPPCPSCQAVQQHLGITPVKPN